MGKTKNWVFQVMAVALLSLALSAPAFAAPPTSNPGGKGITDNGNNSNGYAHANAAAKSGSPAGPTDTGTGGTAITDEPSCLENGGALYISNTCYDVNGNILN